MNEVFPWSKHLTVWNLLHWFARIKNFPSFRQELIKSLFQVVQMLSSINLNNLKLFGVDIKMLSLVFGICTDEHSKMDLSYRIAADKNARNSTANSSSNSRTVKEMHLERGSSIDRRTYENQDFNGSSRQYCQSILSWQNSHPETSWKAFHNLWLILLAMED